LPARQTIHTLALVTLLAVALGCESMDLQIDDRDQFTPSGRISYEIWPGIDQRRSGTLLDLVTGSSGGDPGKAVTVRSAGVKPTISIDGAISAVEGRDHQDVPIQDTEVGVELNLTRNLSLFTGYRWWRYEEGFSSESDWELDIRGPTARASLKF
jgi:hypothetical protein